jgi:cob(I)alamin adenosyltransferase
LISGAILSPNPYSLFPSPEAFTSYRLTKITTRTGDEGKTSLADGTRVKKNSVYMEAIGAVDELNSALGMLAARPLAAPVQELLRHVQNDLFDVGAELSYPGYRCLAAAALERLDAAIAELNGRLPPLEEFILPGGSETGALCHFVRAVCRAAERRVVSWQEANPATTTRTAPAGRPATPDQPQQVKSRLAGDPAAKTMSAGDDLKTPYLNRLSDLLFVLARSINQADGATETRWTAPAARTKQQG